jgi:hypothetical protein
MSDESSDLKSASRIVVPTIVILGAALVAGSRIRHSVADPHQLEAFPYLFATQDVPVAAVMAGILVLSLFALRLPALDRLDDVVRRLGERPGAVAVAVTALLAAGALAIYQNYPLSMDEFAPFFQAEVFSRGRLTGEFPPALLPRLTIRTMWFLGTNLEHGWILSGYLPGFALLLTPFVAIGAPWLLNPLLGGLTVPLVAVLARKLSARPSAPGWAIVLLLASPAFVANAISYYSMGAHLLCTLLYCWLLIEPTWKRSLAAGFVGSIALVLHNPVPHTLVAIPWIVWLAARRERRRFLVPLVVGYLPISLACGPGWLRLLSSIVDKPGTATTGASTRQSFAASVLALLGNVLSLPSWAILGYRLIGFAKLFLWAVPGLPFLALAGYREARNKGPLAPLLGWGVLATLTFYFFVPYDQGHGWGYRYFHPVFATLPLFAAALLERPPASTRFVRLAGALALAGMVVLTPFQLFQIHSYIRDAKLQVPQPPPNTLRLVFVDPHRAYYGQDLVRNDPFLEQPIWVLVSAGEQDERALVHERFPKAVEVGRTHVGTVWDMPLGAAASR